MNTDTPVREVPIDHAFDEATITSDRCADAVLDDIERVGEVPERYEQIA